MYMYGIEMLVEHCVYICRIKYTAQSMFLGCKYQLLLQNVLCRGFETCRANDEVYKLTRVAVFNTVAANLIFQRNFYRSRERKAYNKLFF